jgi:hypothetical protein
LRQQAAVPHPQAAWFQKFPDSPRHTQEENVPNKFVCLPWHMSRIDAPPLHGSKSVTIVQARAPIAGQMLLERS